MERTTRESMTWRPAATSLSDYLEVAGTPAYMRSLTADPPDGSPNPNLLGFVNSGGLLGKGVCWWHSRFTRNALYLGYYLPEEPRPGPAEARRIAVSLMQARKVVAIPGYTGLRDFSLEHRKSVQNLLERQQLVDGVLRFAWVNGLAGRSRVSPNRLRGWMERIHFLSSKGLVYVKYQTPGLDAHALLITESERTEEGFALRVLDSNAPGETRADYRYGSQWLELPSGAVGVPYPQRTREMRRIHGVIRAFLQEHTLRLDHGP